MARTDFGVQALKDKNADLRAILGEMDSGLLKGEKARKVTYRNVTIQRHADQHIVLPDGMSYDDALKWIIKMRDDEEQMVNVRHDIQGYPLDGAYAFSRAMQLVFGFYETKSWRTMFGTQHTELQSIRTGTGPDDVHEVPWGKLTIPGFNREEYITVQSAVANDGVPTFVIAGTVRKKFRDQITYLAMLTEEIMKKDSIYRGNAVRIKFEWLRENRHFNPNTDSPEFIPMDGRRTLIFNDETQAALDAEVYGRVINAEENRYNGVRTRTGILLAGPFGTGKTETALDLAQVATDRMWSFFYLEDPRDLPHALRLARVYSSLSQGVVVFAEDIDGVTAIEDGRTDLVNQISLALDGIESKGHENSVVTVLTTNHPDNIAPVLRRPGRLDAIIYMGELDGPATVRFLREFAVNSDGESLLETDADLTPIMEWIDGLEEVGGFTPVFLHAIVQRAIAIAVNKFGRDIVGKVTPTMLLHAAQSYLKQYLSLTDRETAAPDFRQQMLADISATWERKVKPGLVEEVTMAVADEVQRRW